MKENLTDKINFNSPSENKQSLVRRKMQEREKEKNHDYLMQIGDR